MNMWRKKNPGFLYFVIMLPLLCIGFSAAYGYYIYSQRIAQDKTVLEEIGKRTGLPPNWLAIREFVYCDLLKPGTAKSQIDQGLSLIGSYSSPSNGDSIERIDFINPSIRYNLSPLIIVYDKEWRVVSSGAGEFNHGPRAQCEIERAKGQTPSVSSK
ncbi:MAG: hypothetical protein JW987_04990 [Anaerolineaceae bacterium]|nr:hypothetical protein [Anaerolineaceae bacterium]